MDDLRALFPVRIMHGALLRPDGVAVGLVSGGAPAWDLLAPSARAQAGADFHRLLCSLDAPLDLYLIDQPPDVADALTILLARQEQSHAPVLAAVLGDLADRLAELAQQRSSRAKQVIWSVTVSGARTAPREHGLSARFGRGRRGSASRATPAQQALLAQAVERARRLADALAPLGGTPPARVLEPEAIARLLYTLADPVRAQRYPLSGALLSRLRRIVTVDDEGRQP